MIIPIEKGFYHQILAGIAAGMGGFSCAAVFGWVTPILLHLLSPESEIPMTPEEASWMITSPAFANLFTPIPTGIIADKIGRKPVILISAPLYTISWVIILYFKNYTALLVARSFQGAGIGIVFTIAPVYLGEIASTKYRGAITSLFYIIFWAGYLFDYCTGPFLSFTNFTLLNLVMTVVYFLLVWVQPESPYFHLKMGNKEEAYNSLKHFRNSSEDSIQEELERMFNSVKEDQEKKATWKDVVATSTDRKALYILLLSGSLRVLCGILPIVTYTTQNFNEISDLPIAPEYITILFGIVLFIGACCSFFAMDHFGRRSLIIISTFGSSVSLFLAGAYYYLDSNTTLDLSWYTWLPTTATLVYAAFIVAGLFPVNAAYTSELFNSNTRAVASSIGTLLFTFLALLTLKLYQTFIDLFGVYFNFLLFSGLCLFGAIASYLVMPETKNKTFEQIRKELGTSSQVPVSSFVPTISYMTEHW